MGNFKNYKTCAYVNSQNLEAKRLTHTLYSTKYIDLDGEVIRRLSLQGHEAILDLGCGTGEVLVHLQRQENHNGPLYGLDITSGVFQSASTICKESNSNISFLVGNAELLPYQNNSFDVLMARHMLCHLNDIDRAILEVKRVLRSPKRFVTTANSLKSYPHVRLYRNKIAFEVMGTPVSYTSDKFNVENLESILKAHFRKTDINILEGELEFREIEPFIHYFASTRDVWEPRPNDEEWYRALHLVHKLASKDLSMEGTIREPKLVAIAICEGDKK